MSLADIRQDVGRSNFLRVVPSTSTLVQSAKDNNQSNRYDQSCDAKDNDDESAWSGFAFKAGTDR